MAIHDRYARKTPYEVAIPGREFADTRFAAVRKEAEAAGLDLLDPGRFALLGAVGDIVRDFAGEDQDPTTAIRQHAPVLFHAYRFWDGGEPLFLVGTEVARRIVGWQEAGTEAGRTEAPAPPLPAGYLQLPRNLFWARMGPGEPPEPLDGIFWSSGSEGALHVAGILGVRDDRPGMSVVEFQGLTPSLLAEILNAPGREDGTDFHTDLPGGELEGLYSIQNGAELIQLLGRAFLLLGDDLGLLGPEEGPPKGEGLDPLPSALPYRAIRIRED